MGYFTKTVQDQKNTEILILADTNDEWNSVLFDFFSGFAGFHFEDDVSSKQVDILLEHALGSWFVCIDDSTDFAWDEWDNEIRKFIRINELAYCDDGQVIITDGGFAVMNKEYVENTGLEVDEGCGDELSIMPMAIWKKLY